MSAANQQSGQITGAGPALPTLLQEADPQTEECQQYMEEHGYTENNWENPEKTIDYGETRALVNHVEEADFVVPMGCTGASSEFTHEEQREYISRVAEMADVDVVAGTTTNSLNESLGLGRAVEEYADIDAHLVVFPYKTKPEMKGAERFYETLAEEFEEGVVMYNVPSRTGRNMDPETVARLATHDNIIGIKEAAGEDRQVDETVAMLQEYGVDDFALGSGNDFHNSYIFEQALEAGYDTFAISVSANVAPGMVSAEYEAAASGDYDRAREIASERADLDSPERGMFIETNPGPVMEGLRQQGFETANPRGALDYDMDEENRETLIETMDDLGLLD